MFKQREVDKHVLVNSHALGPHVTSQKHYKTVMILCIMRWRKEAPPGRNLVASHQYLQVKYSNITQGLT